MLGMVKRLVSEKLKLGGWRQKQRLGAFLTSSPWTEPPWRSCLSLTFPTSGLADDDDDDDNDGGGGDDDDYDDNDDDGDDRLD